MELEKEEQTKYRAIRRKEEIKEQKQMEGRETEPTKPKVDSLKRKTKLANL